MNITIIIITAIISILSFNKTELLNKLIFYPYYIHRDQKQMYRFVSSGFIHADFTHLLFNMFTLFFFGENIELVLGKNVYLIFYILGIIISSIPTYLKQKNNHYYRSLGASGGVSAVLFAYIYMMPFSQLYIFFAIPIPAILYAIFFVWYSIRMGKNSQDNINHDAHLMGALFGFIWMLIYLFPTEGFLFGKQIMNYFN